MKSYSIGRDNACDIVLNDHTDVISRRHAVLTVSSSGKMTITDQSTNGTYINGQKISPNVPVPVTRKDSVSFAHVSTLDWNMIPKSSQWLTYLLVGLGMAAIVAACVILVPKVVHNGDDELPIDVVDSITYSIAFDANGGSGSMDRQTVTRGAKTGLVGNAFTREGYDFVGWNTQADGKGTGYEDKATVAFGDNLTLYAQWKQRTHKVTFVPNARKVKGKMEEQEVVEGTDTALSPNNYTRKGFSFVGWNTQPDGKGTVYADKAVVNLKEDLELYAQWKENEGGKKEDPKKEEKQGKQEKQEGTGKQWRF